MDKVEGEAGEDFIMGGTENDYINGGADDDILRGEDGNDTIVSFVGNVSNGVYDGSDDLYGGYGNDYLNAGEGIDWVEGQGDNDQIQSTEVNPAYDHIVGGTGKDSFAVKDFVEHNQANRDNVDIDYFDNKITNKNAFDTTH